MNSKTTYYIFLLFGFLFISCDRDFKEIQRVSKVEFVPTSEAENFVMRYTDSARIKSILKSPLMYDYSNLEYAFTEFPKGVHVTMFDENAKQSYIEADYAINFAKSEVIDLQGNVKITSHNGRILETDQMYYDRQREWIFTELDCKLTVPNGVYFVKGFDAKSDLTQLEGRNFSGSGNFSE